VYKYFRYLNHCTAEFILRLYAVCVLFSIAVSISCITGVLLSKYTAVKVCILKSESHCRENLRTAFCCLNTARAVFVGGIWVWFNPCTKWLTHTRAQNKFWGLISAPLITIVTANMPHKTGKKSSKPTSAVHSYEFILTVFLYAVLSLVVRA